ncbi:MAG: molybdopterin-dependent oxidoreductase [Xanthobacteraceae bacterium]|nr:molybdopterin-dependent oxidoreductase [Xanthobacteraceae bacterium]
MTAGNSVHPAAQAVREKALRTAAPLLDVPQLSLDIRDGIVFATGKSLSLRDIADTLARVNALVAASRNDRGEFSAAC